MENVSYYIQLLNQTDGNWKDKIMENFTDESKKIDKPIDELMKKLVLEIRKKIKQYENDNIEVDLEILVESINKIINNNQLTKKLVDFANNTLKGYYIFKPLRDWERENKEIVKGRMLAIFDNIIERVDIKFLDQYENFGLNSRDKFEDLLNMLDKLTTYYVTKHYTLNAIKLDAKEEMGLCDEICQFYAEQVNARYINLLNSIIIDRLILVDEKAEYISDLFESLLDDDNEE